jgi:hypothetical protein
LIFSTDAVTSVKEGSGLFAGIYPNPAKPGKVNLVVKGLKSEKATLRITNALGQNIMERELEIQGGDIRTSIPMDVPSGAYIVLIQSGGQSIKRTIVVE